MITLDEFIRRYDEDNKVKKAIGDCITKNISTEIALDAISENLQKQLYRYISINDDLDIDDGSNVERDFIKTIRVILSEYFQPKSSTLPKEGGTLTLEEFDKITIGKYSVRVTDKLNNEIDKFINKDLYKFEEYKHKTIKRVYNYYDNIVIVI